MERDNHETTWNFVSSLFFPFLSLDNEWVYIIEAAAACCCDDNHSRVNSLLRWNASSRNIVRVKSNWCKWWCELVSALPSGGEKCDTFVLLLSRGTDRLLFDVTLLRFKSRSCRCKEKYRECEEKKRKEYKLLGHFINTFTLSLGGWDANDEINKILLTSISPTIDQMRLELTFVTVAAGDVAVDTGVLAPVIETLIRWFGLKFDCCWLREWWRLLWTSGADINNDCDCCCCCDCCGCWCCCCCCLLCSAFDWKCTLSSIAARLHRSKPIS